MNYRRVLGHFYPNTNNFCGATYDTFVWYETEIEKPTDEELIAMYEGVKDTWALDEMKLIRNRMLMCCDYRALPDYPNREPWLVYRQELRDLPDNWNGVYPTEPDN